MIKILEIYTDGSAGPTNPGPGGFGIIVIQPNKVEDKIIQTYSERTTETTNNRMEMTAILWAYKNYGVNINTNEFFIEIPKVYSDSSYAVNTFNDWIFKWRANDWKKSNNKTPENMDLLKKFIDLYDQGLRIDLLKIKGHNGHKYNEIVDKMAKGQIKYIAEKDGYTIEFIGSKLKSIEIKNKEENNG